MNLKGKKFKKKFQGEYVRANGVDRSELICCVHVAHATCLLHAAGFEARLFQHEYDHLDGVVYIDHLDEEDREAVQPRLDELVEEFGSGGAL